MIVVTGAAGLVGSHLMKQIKAIPIDRTYGNNLFNPDEAEHALKNATEVYHLAADSGGVAYTSVNRFVLAANNTQIDLDVLRNIKGKLLYASSACAYPVHMQGKGARPLKEMDSLYADAEPGYGTEKRFMEEMVNYLHSDIGLNTHIARFMNIYGPGHKPGRRAQVIQALCERVAQARNGDTIEVWGDGNAVRDFVHVDDVVKAIVGLMATDYHYPVNVGTGIPTTIGELVDRLIRISGKNLKVRFDPSKPVGVHTRVADTSTFQRVLGWKPSITLDEKLPEVYEWVAKQVLVPS